MKSTFSLFFLLLTVTAFSQMATFDSVALNTDTAIVKKDSVSLKKANPGEIKRHSVKKAVLYSALVPGWGQVYNKKWWKVPIIYAGFGGLGFAIGWNAKKWHTYSDAYRMRVDTFPETIDPYVGIYSDANLQTLKNYYRRNMDLSIIFTTVLYALNIIDAAVDAHLFEYDVSDDLTLRVQPQLQLASRPGENSYTGLNITMHFK